MKDDQDKPIVLNFMPLAPQDFDFQVFRRELDDNRQTVPSEQACWTSWMPKNPEEDSGGQQYIRYEVAFTKTEAFDAVGLRSRAVMGLSRLYLFNLVRKACLSNLDDTEYLLKEQFRRRAYFVLDEDECGRGQVWLEPYYLKERDTIGFLTGFEFSKNPAHVFDREVMRRSLSLDAHYRENRDYYSDYLARIATFLEKYRKSLFPLIDAGQLFDVIWPPPGVTPSRLAKRVFQFGQENSGASQFMGVRNHGPFSKVTGAPVLCFVFKAEHRQFAYDLYYSLVGRTNPETFPGLTRMFAMEVQSKVGGVEISSFDAQHVLERVLEYGREHRTDALLPIIVFPWSRLHSTPESDTAYYSIKHAFLSKGLASQFVSLEKLQNKEALKWATSNIGLAIFGKMGGVPWRLKPEHTDCLIVGIGQAHKRDAADRVHRYYAYSILTDSSGVYQKIKVLSESPDEAAYLNGLTSSLANLIKEYVATYRIVVIHTTFALRRKEIEAIERSFVDYEKHGEGDPLIVVLNFDDRSKFMGFALWNNSRVPFESTYLPLSWTEFLVWFEGLHYGKTIVARRVGHPMYVKFGHSSRKLSTEEKQRFLQDAMNLSGANWRGFNAKSMPVSVYYAKLIADYVSSFDRLGLDEIEIENLHPWFL